MSQLGYMVWYTESDKIDPIHMLKSLAEIIGFERADSVYRTTRTSTGPDDDADSVRIGDDILASELFRLYLPGTSLKMDAEKAEIGARIEGAVLAKISENVRGDFMPNRPFFRIGKHYLSNGSIDDKVFARPTVIVGFWGYSTPLDTQKMREAFFALPEVRAEKLRLEHLIGQLSDAIILYF